MSTPKRCIGYGERDSRRADQTQHCPNLALTPPYLWCETCEADRRKQITGQMASITAAFRGESEEEDR